MNREGKQSRCIIFFLVLLYIVFVVCLFIFHPFVACAKETDTTETTDTSKKNVPGGKGNVVHIYGKIVGTGGGFNVIDRTLKANADIELVGFLTDYINDDGVVFQKLLSIVGVRDGVEVNSSSSLSDFVGVTMSYDKNGKLISSQVSDLNGVFSKVTYYQIPNSMYSSVSCSVTGMKVFKDFDSYIAYRKNGSLDGLIKEELDSSWYLKDIRCEVTADDSPSGSGGEEATYIKFFWLTDNLEDGDLIEVKTRNYVKKIGGDKISGFHDYVTWHDNISAFDNLFNFTDKNGETSERASWTVGQKDAVKAWFASLENKPLIFKTYETDIYYFRPVRNGTFGKWCKVTMNRFGDSGSPYIEDVEIGDMDDEGEWERDDGLTDENGGNYGSDQDGNITTPDPDNPFEGTNIVGIFSYLFDFFKSIPSLLGDLPALVNSIIGFLPLPVIGFIAAGVLIAIALRIVGR